MRFPHALYIDYLLSKRCQNIPEHLEELGLPYPSREGIGAAASALGAIPKSWSKTLLKTNLSMRRWLQRKGLVDLWEKPVLLEGAKELLTYPVARSEIEVGTLRDIPYSEIAESINLLTGIVLSPELLGTFRASFWDTARVSDNGWRLYLRYRGNRDIEEALHRRREIRAREFDSRDEVGDVEYLSDILRVVRTKLTELARQPATASSAQAMAMLAKVGMEALASRHEFANPEDVDFDYIESWRERFILDDIEPGSSLSTHLDIKNDESKTTQLVGVADGT